MIEVYIGLGSNLEDPAHQVKQAMQKISQFAQSKLIATSSLYRSKPWGEGTDNQPDYINAVLWMETTLKAPALLSALLIVEQQQGRVREKPYAARTLDCDLLLYGREKIQTKNLIVPHPRMIFRSFVLLPLFEINPYLSIDGKSLEEYLSTCDCTNLQKLA